MPHSYQWSHEDYRNAERVAQIQAQAIVEAQRKEQERLEREARRTVHSTPVEAPPRSYPVRSPRTRTERDREESEARVCTSIAKMRAEKAMAACFGSADYIHNRYGHKVWLGKITEYRNKFGCSEEDAIIRVVRDYKEFEWAHLEDPLIEQFMGHRK